MLLRNILPVITVPFMVMCGCDNIPDTDATVHIVNRSGGKVYFQPESMSGYSEITSLDTVFTVIGSPVYYRLMNGSGNFYPLYISPGSLTEIVVDIDSVAITGSNERENRFMRENPYICRAPHDIRSYSDEWTLFQESEITRLDSLLDTAELDREFIATQKLYHRYTLHNQRLGGFMLAKAFAVDGQEIEPGDHFYDFLDRLKFDDPRILRIPKWYDVVSRALETKESRGLIPVSSDRYMSIYADAIEDADVRSHFLVSLLEQTLKYNYLNDYSAQFPVIRSLITSADAVDRLPDIENDFYRRLEASASVAKGTPMPEFTAKTVDGKEYNINDFRGEYVLIDFWFTGCAPCRAEMPYFDRLAEEFDGHGVRFISLSVDAGPELYATWEQMMRKKSHTPGVLSVNLPDGFNSPLLKRLGITGVPRIMLIDPDGNILEPYARRPSDPKLSSRLSDLIGR